MLDDSRVELVYVLCSCITPKGSDNVGYYSLCLRNRGLYEFSRVESHGVHQWQQLQHGREIYGDSASVLDVVIYIFISFNGYNL